MNLFTDYKKEFLKVLKILKEKKIIDYPINFHNISVELPPKEQFADISTNIALILSKHNKINPIEIANLLKEKFISEFKEFDKIEVAKPGFLNITFKIDFWKSYIQKIVKFNLKYGSNITLVKKYNIEFVSANPTGPLHVGHCRGAIIGDVLANLLKFNGHKVTKEYYVNDYGNQIKNFVESVYSRILEIKYKIKFPLTKDLYPGNYIIDIAKNIINKKNITDFKKKDLILDQLEEESLNQSVILI